MYYVDKKVVLINVSPIICASKLLCRNVGTLLYQINVGLRLLIFELFSQGYVLIRYPTFISFGNLAQGYATTTATVDAFDLFENVNIEKQVPTKER